MNEEQRKAYLEKYKRAKEHGVKFFPDIIYKDTLIMFGLFVLLVGLAIFVGVANEPPADPNDTSYIPRPEWYFLWLFQLLKYFPGQIEWVGTTLLPAVLVLALFLLPFLDKNPNRHWSKRKFAVGVMSAIVIGIVALTIVAAVSTPPVEETEVIANTIAEKIVVGGDLYGIQCVECHGPDGEGGEIQGVEGLEGVVLDPISSTDFMYTFTDDTLFNIIDYGQPDLGMPPFGLGYGGELSRGEIESIVTYMRYTWDDRAEIPQEAAAASAIPALAENEVPSYDVHIQPIIKRYCISCHRPGKENNNYLMGTYEEVMTSGDNAPNIIPGDLNNNLIRMLHREEIDAGGPMPPTKALPDEYINIFEKWVLGDVPQTAEEAAAAAGAGAPAEGAPVEGGEPAPAAGEVTPTP